MRRPSLIGSVVAIVLAGRAAACGSSPATRNPVSPAAPFIAGVLQINGPDTVAPGLTAQFTATTRLSDGTVKSAMDATNLRWRSTNTSVMQVDAGGRASAGQNSGETVVVAEMTNNAAIRALKEVVILPNGTYRVVGAVSEADAPTQRVPGARVEVVGTSLAATTDSSGNYRLYGVPPSAEMRVTGNGYIPVVQNVQLTGHSTRNFQLTLTGPRISLNGLFRLAIDVVGTCSGSPALPADLRNRVYDATVTTTGSLVDVRLTEPRFRVDVYGAGNSFTGRASPADVTFTLFPFYSYFYYYTASITERLPDNTYLTISGSATAVPAGGGVSGPLNGGIVQYDSRFPAFNAARIGVCSPGALRLTLTPR